MTTTLFRHGDSCAVIIDQSMIDQLEINPGTPLEITTDGRSLNITRATASNSQTAVQAASEKVNAKYAQAFKKLAE